MTAGGVIPPPGERASVAPYVRALDAVTDMDDVLVIVGVDYDAVTIGGAAGLLARFTRVQAEVFGRAFVAACWEAGANKRRMDEDVVDAVIHAADCTNPRCEGECDG